jgi:hypothetical protein
MKDLLSIHDFLFEIADVGDWEGAEEQVADRMNAIYHAVWEQIPEQLSVDDINQLMRMIWEELGASEVILEADEEDLIDWALNYSQLYVEKRQSNSDDDEEDAEDDDDDIEEEYEQ